jgi:hypothetical protein
MCGMQVMPVGKQTFVIPAMGERLIGKSKVCIPR